MSTLSADARLTIRNSSISIAAYMRYWAGDGRWGGDRCGCPDDRCIGFHHEAGEECGCLPACIAGVAANPGPAGNNPPLTSLSDARDGVMPLA
jgi:hypothetical protein